MNKLLLKLIACTFVGAFILTLAYNLHSYPSGITGVTQKNGGTEGCICHGFSVPSPNVSVWVTGPDSVPVGQSRTYRIYMAHGPAVTGGFDLAVQFGRLDTSYLDNGVRRENLMDTVQSNYELTQTMPKAFTNDTVFWTFKYTAPGIPLFDTLFPVANSTNSNNLADTADRYNFGIKKIIRTYVPIGILNNTEIANVFNLKQNYPNPFNPVTAIEYEIKSPSEVQLEVFDVRGELVETLVDKKQSKGIYKVSFDGSKVSSGVYFYKMTVKNNTGSDYSLTKKLVLIK